MKLIVTGALFEDDDAARWQDSEFTARQEHIGSRRIMSYIPDAVGEAVASQIRALISDHNATISDLEEEAEATE